MITSGSLALKNAVVLYDRATNELEIYPVATKSADDTYRSFKHWQGLHDEIKSFWSDNAPELVAAAKRAGWVLHPTSTPGVPQPNGLEAERMAEARED